MRRNLYIDLGANAGDTVGWEMAQSNYDCIWAFEPNPKFVPLLRTRFSKPVTVVGKAAWSSDGTAKLYLGHDLSSTLVEGKKAIEKHLEFSISYDSFVTVETVDFARWLIDHVDAEDMLLVKMDIEGAEYCVLDHLLVSGAIDLISELRCEFHHDRFPALTDEHRRLTAAVELRTKLTPWR